MHVPLAPYIPSRDPPIWRHEIEYIPVPLGPTDGWGFAFVSDWARGPTAGQTLFQTSGWVLGFSAGRASPSSGTATSDGANDGSAECFASDSIRDDDSLQANHCCCIMM